MKKNQINKDGKRHGYHEAYWSNGNLWYKGDFKDGKRHGYCEDYYSNGKKVIKEFSYIKLFCF